jgi:drug/metabolite transporter (DMT)-like permease
MVGYILIAKMLVGDKNSPIFSFVGGVFGVTWVTSYIFSIIAYPEDWSLIFGWMCKDYAFPTLWLGVVPGVLGNTTYNYTLKYLNPVIVAIFGNLEPVLGTLLGWLFGY